MARQTNNKEHKLLAIAYASSPLLEVHILMFVVMKLPISAIYHASNIVISTYEASHTFLWVDIVWNSYMVHSVNSQFVNINRVGRKYQSVHRTSGPYDESKLKAHRGHTCFHSIRFWSISLLKPSEKFKNDSSGSLFIKFFFHFTQLGNQFDGNNFIKNWFENVASLITRGKYVVKTQNQTCSSTKKKNTKFKEFFIIFVSPYRCIRSRTIVRNRQSESEHKCEKKSNSCFIAAT